jgi:flagellar hook-associated protein 1
MLSFFATLGIGMRSLQAQRQGVEVAGQNLANVNNTAYARQRLIIQTSSAMPTELGPQGTGADAVAIQQLRNVMVDRQIVSEASVNSFLEAQQRALQYAQSSLGEQIDRRSDSAEGAAAAGGAGAQAGISSSLSAFFNSFQSLSASPSSITERQSVLTKAQTLATRFNQTDQRLQEISRNLNQSLSDDVTSANQLLTEIAGLNDQIVSTEFGGGVANDLRDLRQARLEDLAKLVNVDSSPQPNGALNISISGQLLVSDKHVLDTLQTYDAGGGQMLVRTSTAATPLALTGGSLQGTIDVRDGALATLRTQVNAVATRLIAEVNAAHQAGYDLSGATGASFFTGTNASDIQVNGDLLSDPTKIQASGAADAPGNNQQALAIAQLADTRNPALGNQTFSEKYSQTVAEMGLALSSTDSQLQDQQLVQNMLQGQRESVSGVSVDEEMTELMKYQKAFQASARLITTIDDMLSEVVNLKR